MNGDRRDADRTALKWLTDCELRAALEFRRQALGGESA
jgi:hypothetical protein